MVELEGDPCKPSVLIPPRLTTTKRDTLSNVAGLLIYNTSTDKLNVNTGAGWEVVTSA